MSRSSEEDAGGSLADAEDQVVPMVVSRTRRSNAGNRMSSLLALANVEQNEKVFYEGEGWEEKADDAEFGGADAEAPDDVSLESSDDANEDDGDEEEDAGEKELKRQEKKSRAGRRKEKNAPFFQAAIRRRIKFDAVKSSKASKEDEQKARKKVERVSWLPAAEDGQRRSSSRKLALQNKEQIHRRLKEGENRRLRILAVMQAAARRKEEARSRKALTQADRLTEAARVEKENSKSLYKWEEAEKKREAEQRAKLEALKNRKLEGPFIRFYSGPALWVDNRLAGTGKSAKVEEVEEDAFNLESNAGHKYTNNSEPTYKLADGQQPGQVFGVTEALVPVENDQSRQEDRQVEVQDAAQEPVDGQTTENSEAREVAESLQTISQQPERPAVYEPEQQDSQSVECLNAASEINPQPLTYPHTIMFAPPPGPDNFLHGIYDFATLPDYNSSQHPPAPQTTQTNAAQPPPSQDPLPPSSAASPPFHTSPPPRRIVERAMRNLVMLESFEDIRPRDKEAIARTLFSWTGKISLTSPAHHIGVRAYKQSQHRRATPCAITAQPARYLDPLTHLPYHDRYAYRCIRRLLAHRARWSSLLGCYVGPVYERGAEPAKGVPRGFWGGGAAPAPQRRQ